MAKKIVYSTIDGQIEKLKSQKLIINNEKDAKRILKLYGYSNLIKSYREPYIIRSSGNIEYRSGITFEHIHSLYLFDKILRNAVMASMLDLEEHIKGTAADVIASTFGVDPVDYLDYRKYQNKRKSQKRFSLTSILNKFKETMVTDKEPIHHYIRVYHPLGSNCVQKITEPFTLLDSMISRSSRA